MRRAFAAALFLLATTCGSVGPLTNVGEAIRDDDGDGWFNHANNQRVTLILDQISVPGGRYHVFAEGVRQPFASQFDGATDAADMQPTTVNFTLGSRAVGTWMFEQQDQVLTFTTAVELARDDGKTFTANVRWTNQAGTQDVSFGSEGGGRDWIGRFRVTVDHFADPDPGDANADRDRDGITDIEEAALAQRGGPIGDPERRDLVLVVVNTHQDWGITSLSRNLLRTRFRERGINLYIAWEDGDQSVDARPGTDSDVARDWTPSIDGADVPSVRDRHVFGLARNYAHLALLAKRPATSDAAFGISNATPHAAQNLICRSHLEAPLLGPDIREYQAKCIMHELGHNLGLCHPTDATCETGVLPPSERDPATTVLGSPAEASNPITLAIEAWSRPLDYSPTQWTNADLTRVRP